MSVYDKKKKRNKRAYQIDRKKQGSLLSGVYAAKMVNNLQWVIHRARVCIIPGGSTQSPFLFRACGS